MLRLGALRGRRRRKPRGNDGGYCERFWCSREGAAHRRRSRQSFPPDVLQDLVDDIRVRHIGDHPQPPAAVRAHRDLDPEHASQPPRPGQRRLRRSSEFSLLIVVCHRTAVVVLMAAMARGAAAARCDASVGSSRRCPYRQRAVAGRGALGSTDSQLSDADGDAQ